MAHIQLADTFYDKYVQSIIINKHKRENDKRKWNNIANKARNMNIKNLAKYSDYVTTNMCELKNLKIVLSFIKDWLKQSENFYTKDVVESCSLCNLAKIIVTLNNFENEKELYIINIEKFKQLQKNIKYNKIKII